jgi:hypothetical protein
MPANYSTNYTSDPDNAIDNSIKDFNVSHQTTFNTSMRNVDDTIKKLDENLPKDDVTVLSGSDIGTKEYNDYHKLMSNVGEINSTGRVNFIILGLRLVGVLAIFLSIAVKIWSIQFDLTFHIPSIVEDMGETLLIVGATLVTFVILFFSHGGADGLVNDKWLTSNKIVLSILFLIGLSSSLFFDYRAISNYTTMITDNKKEENLISRTSQLGVQMQKAESKTASLKAEEKGVTESLAKLRKRMEQIGDERSLINKEISSYKKRKETATKKEIKTMNSNIYTSRKQLKELDKEEKNLLDREEKYNFQLSSLDSKKNRIAESKVETISIADVQADEERKIRLILMYVFLVFIELASFGMTLADYISNKNLSRDGRAKASTIQKNSDQEVVINRQLDAIIAKQIKRTGQKVALTGHIMDTFGATSVLQQASTAKMIGTTAGAIMSANDIAVKGQEALMEAQVTDLKGRLAERKSSKLEELVREMIKKEEETDYAKLYKQS